MSEYAKLSITVKAGSNSGDPWVVIHAASVEEAHTIITELLSKGVLGGVTDLAGIFAGVKTVADSGMRGGTAETTQQPAQELPASQSTPPCTTCGGPTKFKSGTSAKGKAYKGYFCVNDRDHTPAWL